MGDLRDVVNDEMQNTMTQAPSESNPQESTMVVFPGRWSCRQVQSRISEELKQREVPLTTRRDHSNLIFLKLDLNTYVIYLYMECK